MVPAILPEIPVDDLEKVPGVVLHGTNHALVLHLDKPCILVEVLECTGQLPGDLLRLLEVHEGAGEDNGKGEDGPSHKRAHHGVHRDEIEPECVDGHPDHKEDGHNGGRLEHDPPLLLKLVHKSSDKTTIEIGIAVLNGRSSPGILTGMYEFHVFRTIGGRIFAKIPVSIGNSFLRRGSGRSDQCCFQGRSPEGDFPGTRENL